MHRPDLDYLLTAIDHVRAARAISRWVRVERKTIGH